MVRLFRSAYDVHIHRSWSLPIPRRPWRFAPTVALAFSVRRCQNSKMPETFILIPGRTSRQGCGISEGKFKENYQSETRQLQVAPADMSRLRLTAGDRVRLKGEHGQIDVAVVAAKGDELPAGVLFIAYGDLSSQLMGGDTHGSGMPTSKGLDVQLERIPS